MDKTNIAAVGMALIAGYIGYGVVDVQWESILPFPIVALLTFAVLVRKDFARKAIGTGLYIIAALLFLLAVHYTVFYRYLLVPLVGFNILFAVGVLTIGWIVLAAVAVAVTGKKLNQSVGSS
ncbi:hypothetical protein [Halorubrum sp. FL23]|uniref:hypothetical protein n=1 Tax=Halorubrum sp. FL23 TaxID=3458704 RepID=UPI00403343BD